MPIDVASGNVHLAATDARIAGRMALSWERRYSATVNPRAAVGPLGPGWTHGYQASLTRYPGGFEFVTPAGAVELLPDPDAEVERGGTIRHLAAELEIFAERDRYVVQRWYAGSERVERYAFLRQAHGVPLPLAAYDGVTGHGLDLIRDEQGRLQLVRQRLERRALRLLYDGADRVEAVMFQAADGALTSLARYEYDAQGRLAAAFDASGYADRYEYDKAGRVLREVLKDGGVFSFRYDRQGRCVRMAGLDRYDEKTLRYHEAVGWTDVTNSLGDTTRHQWLPTGQVVAVVDALGGRSATEYDELGRVTARVQPGGQTTRHEYDEAGNRVLTIDPAGRRWQYSFNARHQPLSFTDPNGRTWRRGYDDRGHLIFIESPDGGRTEYEWDAVGSLRTVRTRRGPVQRYVYDQRGGLVESIDADGNSTRCTQDAFGRTAEVFSASGQRFRVGYDVAGRTTLIEHPDGTTQRFVYDAAGNQTAATDRSGNTRHFRYGPCKRLLEVIDANGGRVQFVWSTEPDRLDTIVNEKGETCRFVHDAVGQLVMQVSFDGRVCTLVRDASSRVVEVRSGEETISFVWDACGRLTERRLPDGTVHRVVYDASGDVIEAVTPDRELRFERDIAGRVVHEAQGSHVITRRYDTEGHRTRMATDLDHVVDYGIDPSGRVERLRLGTGESVSFEFNERGLEGARRLVGGVRLTSDYDSSGRITAQSLVEREEVPSGGRYDSPRVVLHRAYEYAPNGTLLRTTDTRGDTRAYSYDREQQILHAVYSDGFGEAFAYDAAGNLTEVVSGTTREAFTHTAGNRLEAAGNTRYELDAKGRVTARAEVLASGEQREWQFFWDGLDQLRAIRLPNGDEWSYRYDFFGRRVAKQGPASETSFVWDGDSLVHEIPEGKAPVSWVYLEGRSEAVVQITNRGVFSVVPDQIGAPRELVSSSGAISWSAGTSVWGRDRGGRAIDIDCPIRFPGQWHDAESGLHYNRFRYYDPGAGRFISQDPVGPRSALNYYRYAPNPLNWTDLLGLNVCENRQRGEDFKNGVRDEYPQPPFIVHEEVSVKVTVTNADGSTSSVRTRVDLVVVDPNSGTTHYIETKASATAPYTPNQTAAGVGQGTGTFVGPAEMRSDRAGLPPRGTTLPAGTQVTTVRPGDQIPGLPPGTSAKPV